MKKLTSLFLIFAVLASLCCLGGCKSEAEELTPQGLTEIDFAKLSNEEAVAVLQSDFSGDLLRAAYAEKPGENVMVSPMSVMFALAMTANGADGETLAEMEAVLGGRPVSELNEMLGAYMDKLAGKEELKIANSIWVKNGVNAKDAFLTTCAGYYKAPIYRAPFDMGTVKKVNDWVKENTDGMIDKLLEDFSSETRMLLVNALCFDAKWQSPFIHTYEGSFTCSDGSETEVEFMSSEENIYLSYENAQGFVKRYQGNYAFVGILPNEGVSISELLTDLQGTALYELLQKQTDRPINLRIPKFSFDYDAVLNDSLAKMGMPTAFTAQADFSRMTEGEDLFIGQVIHKTHIEFAEEGTRAAAVTGVVMFGTSAAPTEEPILLNFNRPFLFFIIDTETNIPLFSGVLNNP